MFLEYYELETITHKTIYLGDCFEPWQTALHRSNTYDDTATEMRALRSTSPFVIEALLRL